MVFSSLRHILAAMLVLMTLATGAMAAEELSAGVPVRVTPAVSTGVVGSTVTITVEADYLTALGGFQFGFSYSTVDLEALSVAINPAFDNVVAQSIGTTTGSGMIAASVFNNAPVSGTPVTLATLAFKILRPVTSSISLANVILGEVGGVEIVSTPVGGSVTGTPVPTSQTITFGAAPTLVVGGTGTVSATASSGLEVSFSSTTPTICSLNGTTVTPLAAGTCTIAANQSGNATYSPADQVTQSITVTVNQFSINSSVTGNGSINCTTPVIPGGNSSCSIIPGIGYHVSDVIVDSASVGAIASYTFNNVTANHAISATFLPDITPPTGLTSTIFNGQVRLTWTAVSGAASYNIYWATSPGVTAANSTKISNVSGTFYIHIGPSAGNSYYYAATSVGSSGESILSGEVSTTLPTGNTVSYDATADFQGANNPNGVWSYGYSHFGGTGYALSLFDIFSLPNLWQSSQVNSLGTPSFWKNAGTSASFGVGPGQLSLHPGPASNGDIAILRFTAPLTGMYSVTSTFYPGDSGDMSATIILNGNALNPLYFSPTTNGTPSYTGSIRLAQGDSVDFAVGNNGSFLNGNTPLSVLIAPVADIVTGKSVTYNGNGNTGGSAPIDSTSYLQSAPVTVLANTFNRTGYTFASWNTLANGGGISYAPAASFSMGTADVSLYAQWIINSYSLTYSAGANGTISGTTPQTVNYNSSGTAVTAVPNSGYHFVNWSDGNTSATRIDSGITSNLNLTASFAPDPVSGACGSSAGGVFRSTPATALCNPEAAVSITTTTSGWSWICPGTNNGADAICAATRDTTGPELTVSTLAHGAVTNNPTLNVSGTVFDTSGIDTVIVSNNSTPATITITGNSFSASVTLVSGTNSITSTATDRLGNSTMDIRTITLYITGPLLIVSAPADNSKTAQGTTTVTGTIDENSTVSIRINSGTPQNASITANAFSADLNLFPDLNTITITATDLVGNSTSTARSVTYDNTNPSLAITSPNQDITTPNSSITISGTVSDTITTPTVSISFNNQTYRPGISGGIFSQQFTMPAEGTYPIIATATDEVGNFSSVTRNIIYAIPVDGVCGTSAGKSFSTAPTSNLCAAGTASAVSTAAPWTWTCSSINSGTTASCSASLTGTYIPDGILVPGANKVKPGLDDALVILRIAIGDLIPTDEQLRHGDVAPLVSTTGSGEAIVWTPAPDGKITLGDAVVLLRRIVDLVSW